MATQCQFDTHTLYEHPAGAGDRRHSAWDPSLQRHERGQCGGQATERLEGLTPGALHPCTDEHSEQRRGGGVRAGRAMVGAAKGGTAPHTLPALHLAARQLTSRKHLSHQLNKTQHKTSVRHSWSEQRGMPGRVGSSRRHIRRAQHWRAQLKQQRAARRTLDSTLHLVQTCTASEERGENLTTATAARTQAAAGQRSERRGGEAQRLMTTTTTGAPRRSARNNMGAASDAAMSMVRTRYTRRCAQQQRAHSGGLGGQTASTTTGSAGARHAQRHERGTRRGAR